MYKVDISPAANSVLEEYTFRCARDNGEECALRLLDSFDEKVAHLEQIISASSFLLESRKNKNRSF